MDKTKIDWCDSTWNPITGCLHGCEYCYARDISEIRFKGRKGHEINEDNVRFIFHFDGSPTLYELDKPCYYDKIEELERIKTDIKAPYPYGFKPTFHRYKLNDYIGKQGRNIFVCSMADLFGSWVPDEWIEEVFAACDKAPQHNYLFLTKNPQRYAELAEKGILRCSDHMWYGWSETSEINRPNFMYFPNTLPNPLKTFVSVEPILGPVHPGLGDWIIIGAETGRRKDKVIPKREWIEQIVDDCRKYDIPLFMKSSLSEIWGEPLIQEFPKGLKKEGGRLWRD